MTRVEQRKFEAMELALKVIRTWAAVAMDGYPDALDPRQTVELIDRVLETVGGDA